MPPHSPTQTAGERAAATYAALQTHLYDAATHLYRAQPPSARNAYAFLWPFTLAMAATAFMVASPAGDRYADDLGDRVTGLLRYRNTDQRDPSGNPQPAAFSSAVRPPLGSGGDTYYDDNAWAALNLVYLCRLTGDGNALALARQTFDFIVTGWSADSSLRCPGGVRWVDAAVNGDRNTVSTATSAQLAAELCLLTGETSYLSWAQRMYQWVDTCLMQPNGLYGDHIAPDGTIDATEWSYNQGAMIGAAALLGRATGDTSYLDKASSVAATAVSHYGTGTLLADQGAAFNAIYFRNLLLLDQVRPAPGYRAQAEEYADAMWNNARDRSSGLFQPAGVTSTAPMVSLFALLAGAPPEPPTARSDRPSPTGR